VLNNNSQQSVILSPDEQYLSLANLDLPEYVLSYYRVKGIHCLMKWQYEALHLPGVLEGKNNLIFSAPTSAGKTIVSDVLLIRSVMLKQRKALIILPYISLANEKVTALEYMLKYSKLQVAGFMGNSLPNGRFPGADIAVCTIEKANNIINRLIEENTLKDVGMVIVDEFHEVGMSERGAILEQTLSKLNYCKKYLDVDIQIVGMSATLPNIDQMSMWLDAQCYVTTERPVPLREMIKIDKIIYDAKTNEEVFNIDNLEVKVTGDTKGTLSMALDSIILNNGVLIFCESKTLTETLARNLSKTIHNLKAYSGEVDRFLRAKEQLIANLRNAQLEEIIEQLKKCPSKLDDNLREFIPNSVAFHHAGLSMQERDIIESGFKNGSIKALFATPTLSSGVNLPVRRVVIHSAKVGIENMSALTYRQMCGRAGRKNIDDQGESIIIVNPNRRDEEYIQKLIHAPLEPIKSKAIELNPTTGQLLINERSKRFVLESIATGMLSTFDEIKDFVGCSFFVQQSRQLTDDELNLLLDQLIVLSDQGDQSIQRIIDEKGVQRFVPSKLGVGILASSFPPDEAIRLKHELCEAMDGLSLNCDLHLLYYVIPNSNLDTKRIDWQKYRDILLQITEDAKKAHIRKVMNNLKICIGFVQRTNDQTPYTGEKGKHIKFYYAFALCDIMREKTLKEVSEKYKINRGELQALQQRSSSYCGMLSIFAKN